MASERYLTLPDKERNSIPANGSPKQSSPDHSVPDADTNISSVVSSCAHLASFVDSKNKSHLSPPPCRFARWIPGFQIARLSIGVPLHPTAKARNSTRPIGYPSKIAPDACFPDVYSKISAPCSPPLIMDLSSDMYFEGIKKKTPVAPDPSLRQI